MEKLKKLSREEMKNVVGGNGLCNPCCGNGYECVTHDDCCQGLVCVYPSGAKKGLCIKYGS